VDINGAPPTGDAQVRISHDAKRGGPDAHDRIGVARLGGDAWPIAPLKEGTAEHEIRPAAATAFGT